MDREQPLPDGSRIQIEREMAGLHLWWKGPPYSGCLRIPIAAFMLVWLGGWAAGEWAALGMLWNFKLDGVKTMFDWIPVVFIAVWLIGWTVGGLFALVILLLMLLPEKPERLWIGLDALTHDPGRIMYSSSSSDDDDDQDAELLKDVKKSFRKYELLRSAIESIDLVRVGKRQLLLVKTSEGRYELGASLAEPDRKWLAEVLRRWLG